MRGWWKWLVPVLLVVPLVAYAAGRVVADEPPAEPRTPVEIVSTPTDDPTDGPTSDPATPRPSTTPEPTRSGRPTPTTLHPLPDDPDDDDDDDGRDDDDDDDDGDDD